MVDQMLQTQRYKSAIQFEIAHIYIIKFKTVVMMFLMITP